jgi:hypothetical protein
MRFERTQDYSRVRGILTDPGIFRFMGDDFCTLDDFEVNLHPLIWYVLVRSDQHIISRGGTIGLFSFFPENPISWWVHVAFFRKIPPSLTCEAGRQIVPWVWKNTPCRRLIASVPAYNRAAVGYGLDSKGMNLQQMGTNPASFLKHGKLWDQVLMGTSRPGA